MRKRLFIVVISAFVSFHSNPAACDTVGVDWDWTANCTQSGISVCPGFCEAIMSVCRSSGDGATFCDASRNRVSPEKWNTVLNQCKAGFPGFPDIVVSPQGSDGCPRIKWLQSSASRACQFARHVVDPYMIDNRCENGFFSCSGGAVPCSDPADYVGVAVPTPVACTRPKPTAVPDVVQPEPTPPLPDFS